MIVNWNLFDIWILDFVILSGKVCLTATGISRHSDPNSPLIKPNSIPSELN